MNRRTFLSAIIAVPLAAKIPFKKKEDLFFGQFTLHGAPVIPNMNWDITRFDYIDPTLFGIPYHQSNASVSSWLGFERK